MIVSEHTIRDIIATIPAIQINSNNLLKPKFHWGDEDELNRYVQLMKEGSYPLIWLLPSPDNYEGALGQDLTKECSFIIATREIGDNWKILKLPNYSAESDKNGTIDLWDAISLTIDVRFNSNLKCLNTISYVSN